MSSPSSFSSHPHSFNILGAGVIGLTTALVLREAYPDSRIQIIASHLPGDYHVDYTSPWAGGNWCSSANDNGLLESFDRYTFHKFAELARSHPECGIASSPLRMIFDSQIEDAGILSKGTTTEKEAAGKGKGKGKGKKVWYDELVGGVDAVPEGQLPEGAVFGLDLKSTFVINTEVYLKWLVSQCETQSIALTRAKLTHINQAFSSSSSSSSPSSPLVTAVFNCTALGSLSLGGVKDQSLYPTRGQTVLVQQPKPPLRRMYFRSPERVNNDTTYIFQRPLGGGVVLGGCREDGNWDGEPDMAFARKIMQRCCELVAAAGGGEGEGELLGKPEDLQVIRHGVGLRPSRKGGPRIEVEEVEEVVSVTQNAKGEQEGEEEEEEGKGNNMLVVHNYGASGAGYQASWGMARHGVGLLRDALEAKGGGGSGAARL